MRVITTLAILLTGLTVEAQVYIGNDPGTNHSSEILNLDTANKGILIPNVELVALNSPAPITSPAPNLLVYNTNTAVGEGFYVWLTTPTNHWEPMIDARNVYAYAGIVRTSLSVSNNGQNDNSTNGANTYTIGEAPSAHGWQLIPGVSKQIEIFSPINNISVSVGGLVQTNSTSTTQAHSYAVAVFIDNQLAAVRNFVLSGSIACNYDNFNVFMTQNNLTPGLHTIEVYTTWRVNLNNISGAYLRFGERIGACTNLSNDMSRTLMSVQISEKPNN